MIVLQKVCMSAVFVNNDFEIDAKTWASSNCSNKWWHNINWDPSGKDSTRKILNQREINRNIQSIKKVFNKILDTKIKKQTILLTTLNG